MVVDMKEPIKVYVDQLGAVFVPEPIAVKIWRHAPRLYASGRFSTHVHISDTLTVHRFIDQYTYDVLKELKAIQDVLEIDVQRENERDQQIINSLDRPVP